MTLQEMQIPDSFFEDEVRDGFFIPSIMKRNWACQLEILKVIDEICIGHGIRWYIDSGTLLGAVRHHGFIPWDDDIDIIMRRSDQLRFIEAAQTELPPGFILKNPDADEDATNSNIMLFNSDEIDTSTERMNRFHGFPYGVCVDIFTLDGVASNHMEHEKIHDRIDPIREAITLLKQKCNKTAEFRTLIKRIEQDNQVSLSSSKHLEGDLWRLMVRHHRTISDTDAGKYEFFWGKDDRLIFDAKEYEQTVMLPFEFLELPAPAGYKNVLKTVYGDYHIVYRGGAHSYPVFAGQERKLAEDMGCNPFRYTMTVENVLTEKTETPLQQAKNMLAVMEKACQGLKAVGDDSEAAAKLLIAMQQLVSKLMELLTPVFSPVPAAVQQSKLAEGSLSSSISENSALCGLQQLSADIFSAFQKWGSEKAGVLEEQVQAVQEMIVAAYAERNEIVFLVACEAWWPQMQDLWQLFQKKNVQVMVNNQSSESERDGAKSEQDVHVYCVKQPLYRKNLNVSKGDLVYADETGASIPACAETDDYDFAARHPSKIIMQFPFDGTGTALTTDEKYYSYHLKNFTDDLIYVPCFAPRAESENDSVLKAAMRYLIEEPAVAFADRVVVSDELIRSIYIEELTRITGKDMEKFWEEKIVTSDVLRVSGGN